APRKDQRANDERIRGEGETRPIHRNDGAIVALLEHGIAEGRNENLFDELMSEASSAPVRQHDAVVSDSRDRTAQVERFGVCHSDSRPRTRLPTIPWARPADFPGCTLLRKQRTRAAS